MPDGKIAPTTLYGELLKKTNRLMKDLVTDLKPGESAKLDFYLNRIFDMSLAGKYTVRVSSPNVSIEEPKEVVIVKSVDLHLEVKTLPENWD